MSSSDVTILSWDAGEEREEKNDEGKGEGSGREVGSEDRG